MITQKYIKSILNYNTETGVFTWAKDKGSRASVGDIAGFSRPDGYRQIIINGKHQLAHRLAFLYVYGRLPFAHIDHINGIPSDNRLVNIREVTPMENHRNQKINKKNTSGVVGVCWHKKAQKWHAQIRVKYKNKSLGLYRDKDDAIKARKSAESLYGFHENHGRLTHPQQCTN